MAHHDPARSLVVVALVLAAAATAAALDLARRGDGAAEASAAFQRLAGGLGTGLALDASRCSAKFDWPRADHVCSDHFEPVPGGLVLCPWLGRPSIVSGR